MSEKDLVITATIAQEADGHTNTIRLVADGPDPHSPPVWEFTLVAGQVDAAVWTSEIADRVLYGHRYRRVEPWFDSTATSGYPSLSATVRRIEDQR